MRLKVKEQKFFSWPYTCKNWEHTWDICKNRSHPRSQKATKSYPTDDVPWPKTFRFFLRMEVVFSMVSSSNITQELVRNADSRAPHQVYWTRNWGRSPNPCRSVLINIPCMVFVICNCKECHDKHFCSFTFVLRTDCFFTIGSYQIKVCSVEL